MLLRRVAKKVVQNCLKLDRKHFEIQIKITDNRKSERLAENELRHENQTKKWGNYSKEAYDEQIPVKRNSPAICKLSEVNRVETSLTY